MFVCLLCVLWCIRCCIHDQIGHDAQIHLLNDTSEVHARRLLQQAGIPTTGSIRVQLDTSTFDITTIEGKNLLNVVSIAKVFWQNTLEVERLSTLTFPIPPGANVSNITCFDLQVPQRIVSSNYPDKDVGFIVQSLKLGPRGEVARSFPCAQLTSNMRPVWSLVGFNTDYLQYDPLSFQNSMQIHEMTHCLGFSYMLYSSYPNGNPTVTSNGQQYLNSTPIQRQVLRQYNCGTSPGMLLESQGMSGTAGSHWSRKAAGNEYMTATVVFSNPTISYLTLSLLESTGWYTRVHTQYAKTVTYGYHAGCQMLDPTDCTSKEFCNVSGQTACDTDGLAGSHCTTDSYSTVCSYFQYYSNYICSDPTYTNKNINNQGNTGETPGYNSRCFSSTIRGNGEAQPKYSMRCFPIACSPDDSTITLKVGSVRVLCKIPNQNITVSGFDGTITCPLDFQSICRTKACPNNCYSNGVCIKGRCVCSEGYSGSYCMYPVSGPGTLSVSNEVFVDRNMVCMVGTYLTELGDCEPCPPRCAKCTESGCIVCLDGSLPANSQCN